MAGCRSPAGVRRLYSASCIWRTDAQEAASSAPSPIEAPDQTAQAGYRAPWEEHTHRESKLELRLGVSQS